MAGSSRRERSRFSDFLDVAELLAGMDLAGVTPDRLKAEFHQALQGRTQRVRDTYQACLGRLPEPQFATTRYPDLRAAAAHLSASLTCDEFLYSLPRLMVNAFPSAERTFFLHVPKTAGSSVKQAFKEAGRDLVVDLAFADRESLESDESWSFLFGQIADQYRFPAKSIAVMGHITATDLISRNLVRGKDTVFTVVRKPELSVVSALNYAFTTLIEHPGRKDARHFQRWVESAGYAAPTSPEDVTAAMAEAVLFSEGLTAEWRGLLLTYLSLDQTIEGALNAIAMLDMDVVEMAGLDRYMHREFDLALPTRNESMKFVPDFGSLSPKSRQHILNEICKDDLVLYDTLVSHMEHGDDGVLRPLRDLVA